MSRFKSPLFIGGKAILRFARLGLAQESERGAASRSESAKGLELQGGS